MPLFKGSWFEKGSHSNGGLSMVSNKYIPLIFSPDSITILFALRVTPFPFPKVVVSPVLSIALTEIRLAFNVSV
jgi:hypothetical protein